jgi:mannose-6-phosphate isomerase-like protein (cupin superfamily)
MNRSRRDWCSRLPTLVASAAATAYSKPGGSLSSHAYRFEDLPAHASNGNTFRPVLEGETHTGAFIELHESDLAPGAMPHPPHHHVHEEMFLVREGALDVTISGKTSRLGPGSVAFVASNQEHGVRNPGTVHAQYFVLALGRDQ